MRKPGIKPSHDTRQPARAIAAVATREPWAGIVGFALLLAAIAALLAAPAFGSYDDEGEAYGFVLRAEGDVLLAGLEQQDAVEAETNHPLLTGDQITTGAGRTELVLPDGSAVRVDRGTNLVFESLASSPDSEPGAATLIALDDGKIQIRTPEQFYGAEDLAVRTANATIYLGPAGSYRVKTRGTSFTEVVVREGYAEAATSSGSAVAREGDALEISGYDRPFVEVLAAGVLDALELWAGDLDQEAYAARTDYVDPRLRYAAAPLYGNGEWVYFEGRRVWRPFVRSDWRPFRHGRWVYTPSGLTWVPSARWGWVTSHYGSWDYAPGYGWVWFPGRFYQPAGVYWYWGPTHVGWIPYGYYARHYNWGFNFGVYGWAGGNWNYWSDWTFCPTRYFGRRGYDRYWDTGQELARTRRFAVPRGIVTTDTRGLTRDRWGKPNELLETLQRNPRATARVRDLPDVTDFVARQKLSEAREREIRATELAAAKGRLRPLSGESDRGRLTTRTSTRRSTLETSSRGTRSTSVGSRSLSREADGVSTRSRELPGSSSERSLTRTEGVSSTRRGLTRTESGSRSREVDTRSGATIRRVEPDDSRREVESNRRPLTARPDTTRERESSDGDRPRRLERPTETRESTRSGVRSLSGRSTPDSSQARRVLDRIRAHRETAKKAPPATSGARRPTATSRGSSVSGSSARSGASSSSKGLSRGSSGSSSKPSARGSSSSRGNQDSARSGGSSRTRTERSSPPPRRQSASSGSRSGGGSKGRSTARVRRPNA